MVVVVVVVVVVVAAGQMLLQVTASQSKTLTMFGELYKRVARLADAPLASLFADLRRFVAGRTVDDDQVRPALSPRPSHHAPFHHAPFCGSCGPCLLVSVG